MLLLSKLGRFFGATFEAPIAGGAQIYKAPRIFSKPGGLAPAFGRGRLGGEEGAGLSGDNS